jgi:hypothetical protein
MSESVHKEASEAREINDGGPAFPGDAVNDHPMPCGPRPQPGMSLRDWFAGQALAGATSTITNVDRSAKEDRAKVFLLLAEVVYEIADSMLAARGGAA